MIKKKTFAVSNDGIPPAMDPKSLQCRVTLLDGEEIVQDFNRKVPGQMVLDWVASTLGILEREYFGLLYLSDKAQMQWLDLVKPLKKQITKVSCRFSFLVKFYAVDPATLQGLTRHLFVMQLKRDIAAGTLVLPQASRTQILAFILQAELGDLNPLLQRENYISHFHLLPNQTPELEHEMEENHEKLRGMSRKEAILKFLLRVKWLDGYGLRQYSVKGIKNSIMQLGISPPGVSLYQRGTKTVTYLWAQIIRVSYKGKKFTLTVVKDEGKPHVLSFEMDSFSKTKNMWKITIDMLNFYRSQAEGVTIGREVDSLVDVLDTQGSPHPTLSRKFTGGFQGCRGSPRRSSLPLSARHAITASPGSAESSPQPPRFADLLDSAEHNERGIDVTFPPTPPSSRSEHESSHLHMSAELSFNAENVSPDSGSEHYRRFAAVQAALHPAAALRSSGRRRFKSHLLQLGEDDESRDLESSELRTYKNYVLATDSPVANGKSSGFHGNLAPSPIRSKSTSPTYVNLQYHLEGGNEKRLYAVEEKGDNSSDEEDKEASFKASEVSSKDRCYSALGISHEPKLSHSSKENGNWYNEEPAPVRQTRHDVFPSSLHSPTFTSHGHGPARWKETTKNQMSSKGVADQPNIHVRHVSADDKVLLASATEKANRPRSSSLQAVAVRRYSKARARRVSGSSKDTVSDNEDSHSLRSSSKSSMRSQESLMKLAETLGYVPTEMDPPSRAAVEPMEPPKVFRHSPSDYTQTWGNSKSHLYENLPDEDIVAAITATSHYDPKDCAVDHPKLEYSSTSVNSTPMSADYLKNASALIHVGGKKPSEITLPVNADLSKKQDQPYSHPWSAQGGSDGHKSVSRTPSNVTLTRVITPPPEFAGDSDSEREEIAEDQGKDFTVDWTPHISRKSSFAVRSKSEESISISASALERRIHQMQQTGEAVASGLVTSSAMEATTASMDRKEKWDRQGADLGSSSEARMDEVAPYTHKGSSLSISKLPGYISVSPVEEPQHAERLFISNPSGGLDVEMSDGRNSPDFPAGLMKPLQFTSEQQLTSSASSSPGSKISQCIIATSSPKLKLLGDNRHPQPLSQLAKLVDQMQDSSPKPPAQRKAASTRKETDPRDIVRKRLQMPDNSEVEEPLSGDMKTKKEPSRREAKELRNRVTEYRSLKGDTSSAVVTSRERQGGKVALSAKPLGSKQEDPQYRVVDGRGHMKKRTANTSEVNATAAAQGRGGAHRWSPGPAHPVAQRQAQDMTPRNIPLTHQPSPMQSQFPSAEYYQDLIDPYAVSRRYYPDELSQMPSSSPTGMALGYNQYGNFPSQRMSPSPVNLQFVGEPVLSQQAPFSPNMRNSFQYHSFQNFSQHRKNPFYPNYPARVISPATPPPLYLHPPDYYQGPTRRDMESPDSLRRQPHGQEERFDKSAAVTSDQSTYQQLPKQQRHRTGVHNSLQRPPSRADAPRRFMSPDQPMPRMLMHSQEPLHLSQPVTSSAYHYERIPFNPNLRHSVRTAPVTAIKPMTSYGYAASRQSQPAPTQQQPVYARYPPGGASQQRPVGRPHATSPTVLTTPASSGSARRSYETLVEEDTSEVTYCLL